MFMSWPLSRMQKTQTEVKSLHPMSGLRDENSSDWLILTPNEASSHELYPLPILLAQAI